METLRVITAAGPNVRAALAAARRAAALRIQDSREVVRSGGEDGLYRVTLADGTVVEATMTPRRAAEARL